MREARISTDMDFVVVKKEVNPKTKFFLSEFLADLCCYPLLWILGHKRPTQVPPAGCLGGKLDLYGGARSRTAAPPHPHKPDEVVWACSCMGMGGLTKSPWLGFSGTSHLLSR